MVINTNLLGAGATQLANAAERPGSKAKAIGSPQPAGAPSALSSQVTGSFTGPASEIVDAAAAGKGVQTARAGIFGQPGIAMLAQANLSPEMVLSLLQD
jgi:hypothetical protein